MTEPCSIPAEIRRAATRATLGILILFPILVLLPCGVLALTWQHLIGIPNAAHERAVKAANPWTPDRVAESKRRAVPIIEALKRYRHDRGWWPRRLDELVPDYIAVIDPPAAGTPEWNYGVTSHDEAGISFAYPVHPRAWDDGPGWGYTVTTREPLGWQHDWR